MKRRQWIDTDLEGLELILARRGGKYFALYELLQNCWDEEPTLVTCVLTPIANRPAAYLVVTDNSSDGFSDLRDAFTLFKESKKKNKPDKAGRFNMGEKLVLAICESAQVITTCGTVIFHSDGRRVITKEKRKHGTVFSAVIKMTRDELDEAIEKLKLLIPPKNIITRINDFELERRSTVVVFNQPLQTEISDEDGRLKRTTRKTDVEVYKTGDGEIGSIYELGIPVVETGDKFHVNVLQKIPLNMDRDNVPPAFLQTIRTLTLNHTSHLISAEDTTDTWVQEATSDDRCDKKAFTTVIDQRFGTKRVAYDPSDPEGSKIAVSKGYEVISGRTLSKGQWANAKAFQSVKPAGQVTPSPKPYDPSGKPLNEIPVENWTPRMHDVANFYKALAPELIHSKIMIVIANDSALKAVATYGSSGVLVLNKSRLGNNFFEEFPENMERVCDLFIHEMGHEYFLDHLSDQYHTCLTKLGSKLAVAALEKPHLFRRETWGKKKSSKAVS